MIVVWITRNGESDVKRFDLFRDQRGTRFTIIMHERVNRLGWNYMNSAHKYRTDLKYISLEYCYEDHLNIDF